MTTDQRPDRGFDTLSAEDLVLRLLASREYLEPDEAARLLAVLRTDWTGHGTPPEPACKQTADRTEQAAPVGLCTCIHPPEEDAGVLLHAAYCPKSPVAKDVRPGPDYSAVYLDQHGNVWSDYPTVPAGEDVLPLVWAPEQAQSKADLADAGTELRVIGWCK